MGQQQSRDELLYQQVSYGNVEGIKSLVRDGAGLEWVDKDGKTALIQASMNAELYHVAQTLIDLGANVNAYRPGRNAGTPLHHAAKRGLDQMAKLLLLNGANALAINDDCQTPLEVARAKGFANVVRTIESYICLFYGWMREFYGPGFLDVIAQLVCRKVWVVILPVGSRNLSAPFKLELAIYSTAQDAKPRTLIPLWKSNLLEAKPGITDPSVTIALNSKTRVRLASADEGDMEQLQWFTDACKGIPRATHPPAFLRSSHPPAGEASAPPFTEDLELAMAIKASLESGVPQPDRYGASTSHAGHQFAETIASSERRRDPTNGWGDSNDSSIGWGIEKPSSSGTACSKLAPIEPQADPTNGWGMDNASSRGNTFSGTGSQAASAPAAETVTEMGPIQYPTIDATPLAPLQTLLTTEGSKQAGGSSLCVICLDAPAEAACIPCGHVAGCLSCLNGIKAKDWGCPVCRSTIDQVVKLYAV